MAYRETLLETAKRLLAKPVEPGLGLLGLFEDSNRLLVRLRWLEKKTWKHSRLRIGVVLMAMAFMGACILPMAAIENPQPSMLLTGIVTDADTGMPIAGAKVSDDGYGTKPYRQGVTDANGTYQYLTWPEEHNIVVQADGYKSQHKVLTTSLLQNEKEKGLSFTLTENRVGKESPTLPPEPTEQDEQAIRKQVNQFWWAIRTNNAKALEKMIETNNEDRKLVEQFMELAGQDFQVNEKSSKSKAVSIPIILQTRKTSRNRFQALVLLPAKDGFHWRSLHVSKTGSQYYLNLGIKQRIEQILQAQMMSPVQIGRKVMAEQRERWRKADAEELKTLIQEKIRESEDMIAAREYARKNNIIIVPNVPIEQSRETLNKLKTTPPEQLRKQILEEGGRFGVFGGFGGYGGSRGVYGGFRGGYAEEGPVESVKQRKLIKLETRFLRIPTKFISTLKSDQIFENSEVATFLEDLEKGEVATSLLDPVQIDFLMRFCQASKETQLISAPHVTIIAGETAEIFIGQEIPDSKFSQGLRLRALPTLDDQDRIHLDIQLSHSKITQPTRREEYARGFYGNQVNLQARLQSGQSLLAALPEDFLTDFHTKKSATPTQILMILKAKILPAKKLPVLTQKSKSSAPMIEPLDITQTDVIARAKPSWPESMYLQDRPWQWYVLMQELREWRKRLNDLEIQMKSVMVERQPLLETKGKDHPDLKTVDQKINLYRDQYMIARQKYEEAAAHMRELEDKMVQYQEVTNQLRFLQQQRQQLEQRLLDTRIEYESAESVQQQKKAETLLPALQKQRDRVEAEIQHRQEQLQALRRQMN